MKLALGIVAAGLVLAAVALAGPAIDTDGVFDVLDNCRLLANGPPQDCDTDRDGYGKRCDGDFDNNESSQSNDFGLFVPDFKKGVDSGKGTDMTATAS